MMKKTGLMFCLALISSLTIGSACNCSTNQAPQFQHASVTDMPEPKGNGASSGPDITSAASESPDDYPQVDAEICVIGVFDTYEEGDYTYCTLRNAKLV